MSRVGKLPVQIPDDVKFTQEGDILNFTHNNNVISYKLCRNITIEHKDNEITFIKKNETKHARSEYGTDRSNVFNIIKGIKEGFVTELEITGVGYKFDIIKNLIIFYLGYSHEIFFSLPDSVTAELQKPNILVLKSFNKEILGQVSSQIMSFRETEPYKGKGIKKKGSIILRKEGKKK
jgi:large subunit ribosomal protein L6